MIVAAIIFLKKLKRNDVVSLLLANSIDYLIVVASIRFGTIVSPIPITSSNKNTDLSLEIIKPKLFL